jgi:hypothetical protein
LHERWPRLPDKQLREVAAEIQREVQRQVDEPERATHRVSAPGPARWPPAMCAAVVRLRFDGRKLPKGKLREIAPVYGTLNIDHRPYRRRDCWVPTAWLLDERLDALLPRLRHVRLTRVLGPSFVPIAKTVCAPEAGGPAKCRASW